jgi:hypothetical protein
MPLAHPEPDWENPKPESSVIKLDMALIDLASPRWSRDNSEPRMTRGSLDDLFEFEAVCFDARVEAGSP